MAVHIDFETASEADLPTVGSFKYAEHPTTRALILAYSIRGDHPIGVDLTKPGFLQKLAPLFDAIDRGERICAHNSTFEQNIWTKVCRFPVNPKKNQWDCTAVRARLLALPGSLDGCAAALGIPARKDARGVELINLFSKPQKKKKKGVVDQYWIHPVDRPAEFEEFIRYCIQDVVVEMEIARVLPEMSPIERKTFELDYKINDRGMPVNLELVRKALDFVEQYSERMTEEAVGVAGCRPSQRAKTLEFLKSRGYDLPNLQAATVEKLAVDSSLPPDLCELLNSRIELTRAGTKKLKTILDCASDDGRIRGGFLNAAASTRRWSSVGVQMHNLQKPEGETNPEVVLDLIAAGEANNLSLIFRRPLTAIAQSIRGFFESQTNFLVADYTSIEAVGLAWAAREEWLLEAFRKKQDAYKKAASLVFGIPVEQINSKQRFLGKQLVLGCFSKRTLILTDSGWKKIVDVTTEDLVWDGEEFVNHDGPVPHGVKEVIELCHVQVTPNHEIWNGSSWSPALHIKTDETGQSLQSALSAAILPSWLIESVFIPQKTADSSTTPKVQRTLCEVFDIANAGPRHRYTILTDRGPLIVHNSGYGMGPPRFVETCKKFGMAISEEEAVEAVYGYRNTVPAIVGFWSSIETGAIRAVDTWKSVRVGRFVWRPVELVNGYRLLMLDMPSGSIAYADPSIGLEEWYGKVRKQLRFKTTLGSSWIDTETFGGSLTENVIQALSRDILRDGMLAADDAGFVLCGHCHDEAIAESDRCDGEIQKEFGHVLCTSSPWADDMPISSQIYASKRYRK